MHLFAFSLFLLVGDAERRLNFFVFNRPTQPAWAPAPLPWRWRVAQLRLKTIFVILFALLPFYQFYQQKATIAGSPTKGRLTTGVFAVEKFDAPCPTACAGKTSSSKPALPAASSPPTPCCGSATGAATSPTPSTRFSTPLPSAKWLPIRCPPSRCATPSPTPTAGATRQNPQRFGLRGSAPPAASFSASRAAVSLAVGSESVAPIRDASQCPACCTGTVLTKPARTQSPPPPPFPPASPASGAPAARAWPPAPPAQWALRRPPCPAPHRPHRRPQW